MSSHTYYIEVDGGFLDSSISNVRRKAIEHLWGGKKNESVIIVYSSALKRREVGRVIYTGSWPIFLWKPAKGRAIALRNNGNLNLKKR